MPDLRISTATALWSFRYRFSWMWRAPHAGVAGLIGNVELGCGTPEALEVVKPAGALVEDVDDKTAEIEQRPFGGTRALAVLGFALQVLVQLLFDLGADGLHLRGAEAGADHEVGSEATDFAKIEDGDACCFFILCGIDGDAHAVWQGVQVHRYKSCFTMYSSTRAETRP